MYRSSVLITRPGADMLCVIKIARVLVNKKMVFVNEWDHSPAFTVNKNYGYVEFNGYVLEIDNHL